MDVRERSPGEREEAERKDDAGDAAQRETLFGSEGNAAAGNEFADVTLVVKDVRNDGLFNRASEHRQELVGGKEILTPPMPRPTGMKARPEIPGDQPRAYSKTSGKAPKKQ